MKQHTLERVNANRQWNATTRPWNAMSLADEARARCRAPETTVRIEADVPQQFINAMLRKQLLSESQVKEDKLDTNAIGQILLSSTEEKLFGRIKAARYGS